MKAPRGSGRLYAALLTLMRLDQSRYERNQEALTTTSPVASHTTSLHLNDNA